MDLAAIKEWMTFDHLMNVIQQYRSLGPVAGVLLPTVEAFFPFVPLFLIVLANVNAFGLWLGFTLSWCGASLGSMLVFLFFRQYGQRKLFHFLQRHKQVNRLMDWINRHGFGPLFLLLCFPFTPSALVNVVAGLSNIRFVQYLMAVLIGKLIMIFTISYIGHDVGSLVEHPKKTAFVLAVTFILWLGGKQVEKAMALSAKKKEQRG
ncbi:TVP38/TMEM64 family protein [Falsibacillus albus]|uniref:TVP38/TMEM64 family membrane protein n=1 Tax=Falsibacillus albus TaxID=2478915 RepID=A0A3L7K5B8_9BACI|nr:TVP38/TMEM64 family protein [Falsibacillus albus]RLQ97261.1 TVP38/TMEM64 family protein [Falsibacillus albus]